MAESSGSQIFESPRVGRAVTDARRRAHRRGRTRFGLLCLITLLLAGEAAGDSTARKLGRGVANLGLGVLALPGEVVETSRKSGPFVGATWGVVKGVTMTAVTELVGVWEILTAPFEFPPDRQPILSPEFPWQHFQEDRGREPSRPLPPRVR